MASGDNTGLGLFDETASAAGNFPTALRGYDRQAVDDYIRALETSVVQSRRHAAQLEQQITALQDQLTDTDDRPPAPSGGNDSATGGRAGEILRMAQEQARELTGRATVEAEKIKEQARREADGLRDSAAKENDSVRSGGRNEIEQLRARLNEEIQAQVEKTKAESGALLDAARRESEARRRQSEHEAQTVRQNAYLDAEKLKRAVEREVAELRQKVAGEREAALHHLKSSNDEANAKTSALLAESAKHHRESATRLEADIAEGARIRADAVAEAEDVKQRAAQEAEDRLATAKKQAAAIGERTQQEFAWRKQQLRRETELLHQRKQAVLNQLASLSALAEQTAHSFPDLDDPEDPSATDLTGDPAEGHSTDEMEAPVDAESGPELAESEDGAADADAAVQPKSGDQQTDVQEPRTQETSPQGPHAKESTAKESNATGSNAKESDVEDDDDEMEIDGDATVLVTPGDRPAGTEHLKPPPAKS